MTVWIVVWSGAKDGPHRGLLSVPVIQSREPDRIDRRMAARVHENSRRDTAGVALHPDAGVLRRLSGAAPGSDRFC